MNLSGHSQFESVLEEFAAQSLLFLDPRILCRLYFVEGPLSFDS